MEWVTEVFGFLIVLLVFMLPLLRKFLIDRRKKKEQKEPQEEQEEEEYQEEMEIEEENLPLSPEREHFPVAGKRLVKKDYAFETELQSREFENLVEDRELRTRIDPRFKKRLVSDEFILEKAQKGKQASKNPIVTLTKNKDPLQAMVILSEVFGRYEGPN